LAGRASDCPISADIRREYRAKSAPPEPDRFVADVNASLVQWILYVSKPEKNVDHHRQSDDLGAGLEIPKWGTLGHGETLTKRPVRLNQV
jgi:hypothetical protein